MPGSTPSVTKVAAGLCCYSLNWFGSGRVRHGHREMFGRPIHARFLHSVFIVINWVTARFYASSLLHGLLGSAVASSLGLGRNAVTSMLVRTTAPGKSGPKTNPQACMRRATDNHLKAEGTSQHCVSTCTKFAADPFLMLPLLRSKGG